MSAITSQITSLTIVYSKHDSCKYGHCNISPAIQISFLQYNDVIMSTMAFQITGIWIVYSIVYSDVDQRKHQSSAPLAFVRGIQWDRWSPRTNGQLRGKMFPFDDVIMSHTVTPIASRPNSPTTVPRTPSSLGQKIQFRMAHSMMWRRFEHWWFERMNMKVWLMIRRHTPSWNFVDFCH